MRSLQNSETEGVDEAPAMQAEALKRPLLLRDPGLPCSGRVCRERHAGIKGSAGLRGLSAYKGEASLALSAASHLESALR